jgi:peptidoglycan hydrolase CwlO-like protein
MTNTMWIIFILFGFASILVLAAILRDSFQDLDSRLQDLETKLDDIENCICMLEEVINP